MITGENIYQTIKSEMLELPDLADDTLRELLGHLGRKGKIGGTAGRVWGEALAEAALRFMRQKTQDAKTQDTRPEA